MNLEKAMAVVSRGRPSVPLLITQHRHGRPGGDRSLLAAVEREWSDWKRAEQVVHRARHPESTAPALPRAPSARARSTRARVAPYSIESSSTASTAATASSDAVSSSSELDESSSSSSSVESTAPAKSKTKHKHKSRSHMHTSRSLADLTKDPKFIRAYREEKALGRARDRVVRHAIPILRKAGLDAGGTLRALKKVTRPASEDGTQAIAALRKQGMSEEQIGRIVGMSEREGNRVDTSMQFLGKAKPYVFRPSPSGE